MRHIIRWDFCTLVLILLSVFQSRIVQAQTRQDFSGTYSLKLKDFEGKASYQYLIERRRDTILDGRFSFLRTFENEAEDRVVKAISYSGRYRSGVANGKWQFTFKKLKPQDTYTVDDFSLRYPASGREESVLANFTEGLPSQEWLFLVRAVELGEIVDTLLSVRGKFINAQPSGAFSAKTKIINFSAHYNSSGFATSDWVFVNTKQAYQDTRLFDENGYFIGFEFGDRDTKYSVRFDTVFEDQKSDTLLTTEFFGDVFPYFVDVWRRKHAWITEEVRSKCDSGTVFIVQSLSSLTKKDSLQIWDILPGIKASPNAGHVLLRAFTLNDEDENRIDEMRTTQKKMLEKMENYRKHPQRAFGVLNDEEFAYLDAVMSYFSNVLPQHNTLLAYLNNPARQYFNVDSLLFYVVPKLSFPQEINYDFNEIKRSKAYEFPKLKSNPSLADLHQYFQDFKVSFDHANDQLKAMLEQLEKQSALSDLESDLVEYRDSVLYLFGEENDSKNKYQKDVSILMLGYVDDLFKEYARLEIEQKRDSIDHFLACFKEAVGLYLHLDDLPRKLKRLDEIYTRTIWNPYLMVDMDERVKERVYTAFENYLLPYLLKQIKENISCSKIQKNGENIQTLYDRMLAIRDEDTRDQERALRREKDVDVILQILNVKF